MKSQHTTQMSMPLFPDAAGKMGKLEKAFWKFHQDNPLVYRHLVKFAVEWRKRKGSNSKLGIKALFERVRWELNIDTKSEEFKLNNNNTAFYARLMMRDHISLKDIFQLRRQRIPCTLGPIEG